MAIVPDCLRRPLCSMIVKYHEYHEAFNYCGGICLEVNSGDMFKYKLGKWVLGIDECAFTSL
jgi:hypothetical protein